MQVGTFSGNHLLCGAGKPGAADVCEGGPFVLKRMLLAKGAEVRLSGLREAYFGALLTPKPLADAARATQEDGRAHIVRFVEAIEVHPCASASSWYMTRTAARQIHKACGNLNIL